MSFRDLRRRWTPDWLNTDSRRRWRNVVFRRLGIQRCYTPPVLVERQDLVVRSCLRFLVAEALRRNPDFTFLQIGAYDGVGDDDLAELIEEHELRGILVEPQPEAFARLAEKYRHNPRLVLLRAAISETEGTQTFYRTRHGSSMAASFDRAHLLRHSVPEEDILEDQVPCLTVAGALRKAGFDHVDLVQIDAEGYDDHIVRSIDFAECRPSIVRFEYRNLPDARADACVELLARHGYRFLVEERDILAWHPDGSSADAAPAGRSESRRSLSVPLNGAPA